MMCKGFGLACGLAVFTLVTVACGAPPPDSVTIPRSNTSARNAASSADLQSESGVQPDSDAVTGGSNDVSRLVEQADTRAAVNSAESLPSIEEAIEPAALETVVVPDRLSSSEAPEVDESPIRAGVMEVAAGQFFTADPEHPTSGGMKVFEISGQAIVELADDFSTADTSNLHLVALRGATVPDRIDSSHYVHISKLLAYRGASAYPVPLDVNLDEFGAIAIWCPECNAVLGYAPLQVL